MGRPAAMNGPPMRILLATDLSARCDRALDRAAQLAAEWGAELIALKVVESPQLLESRPVERPARMTTARSRSPGGSPITIRRTVCSAICRRSCVAAASRRACGWSRATSPMPSNARQRRPAPGW